MIKLIFFFFCFLYIYNVFISEKRVQNLDINININNELKIEIKTNLKKISKNKINNIFNDINYLNTTIINCSFVKPEDDLLFKCKKDIFYGTILLNGLIYLKNDNENLLYLFDGSISYKTNSNKYKKPRKISGILKLELEPTMTLYSTINSKYIEMLSDHPTKNLFLSPLKFYLKFALNDFLKIFENN